MFASELKESEIGLYNCTEGGMYIEGFEHCSLDEFIDSNIRNLREEGINEIFSKESKTNEKYAADKKAMRQYVSRNMALGNEIAKFIDGAIEIVSKGDFPEHKLAKFDNSGKSSRFVSFTITAAALRKPCVWLRKSCFATGAPGGRVKSP